MIVAGAKISNENPGDTRLPEVRRRDIGRAGGKRKGRFESCRMIG